MMYKKIQPIRRACLLLVFMITTLVSGALIFGVRAAYAEAGKCNYIGIGGVIECSKVTPIPGYSGTFDEGACYDIVLGATTAVTKKPTCDAPPFASGFTTVVCKDGKAYTGKGTPEEVCKANGTELQDQVIKCLDGTTKTLPSNADDAAKINACKDNCGYNAKDGKKCSDEKIAEKTKQASASAGSANTDAGLDAERKAVRECQGDACVTNNPLVKMVTQLINFTSVLVGIIVVAVIILGGIEYASAGGNPNKVASAKHRITNAILAFVMYIFLFAFLQWLIPGGVFK